jgi:hypothetical protein
LHALTRPFPLGFYIFDLDLLFFAHPESLQKAIPQPMTSDLSKILESKRAFRRRAATRPIEEKLAMLNALRERALTIRPDKSPPSFSSPAGTKRE